MSKPHIILASASIGRKTLLTKLGVPFSVQVSAIDEDTIIHQNPYKMLQMRAQAKAEDIVKQLTDKTSPLPSPSKEEGVPPLPKRGSGGVATTNYKLQTTNYLVIAADSMAVLGDKTYGKARNKADARRIVSELMGKTHVFATATCIIHLTLFVIPAILRQAQDGLRRAQSNREHCRTKAGIRTSKKRVPGHLPANALHRQLQAGAGDDKLTEVNCWESLTKTSVTLRQLTNNALNDYASRYDFTRFAAGYALAETPWDLVTKIDGSYTNVIGLPFEVLLPILRSLKILQF